MRELKQFLILGLLWGGLVSQSSAQNPWQQDRGEALISPFVSRYQADFYRDKSGNKIPFEQDGLFQNYNPRLYFSFPIKGYKINLFGTVPLFFNQYKDANETQKNTDLGDLELGLRFHLKQLERSYLLASVTAFIPAYQNNNLPYAGFDRLGMEARVMLYGNAAWIGDTNNFHKVEAGLRYFFPDDPLQLRVYASEGYRFAKKLVALGELDCIFSNSTNAEFFENNLQLVSDFGMVKAAINLGYEFTPDFAIYGGLFHDIYNKNSGIGRGFQFFSVIKFKK
ncbi:hypothetical protein [Algoriphagus taiwanensis]|uniref:Transporter n=1 Tax=Algoriphagus taiwanensis TaxID=1445656 RepID=A0ABQ6Q5A4_9BACT|nr:hypothetical protein Ataiwa_35260 [Algoriphagus taiwanensis]